MEKTIKESNKNCDYALIVPFKNESFRLHQLVHRMLELNLPSVVDIILVDGGSTDDSLDLSLFPVQQINTIVSIPSQGLSQQLLLGFRISKKRAYNATFTIDANGKDDPIFVFEMIKKIEKGYQFIQASRYMPGGKGVHTPRIRHMAIRYLHTPLLRWSSGFPWTDTTQGFRGYSNVIFDDKKIDIFRDIFVTYELLAYFNYVLPRTGYSCIEIPVVRTYPKHELPTKIKGWAGHLNLLQILVKACLGAYNPKK